MTGIYLFGKDKDGKRVPMEIEHLTRKELNASMEDRDNEELINWIATLCEVIVKAEDFLESEGYIKQDHTEEI